MKLILIAGPSAGAYHMVDTTRSLGKPVWFDLAEIPAPTG